MFAVGLSVATFGYLALVAMGVDVSGWNSFVYDTCSLFCHQKDERSFHLAGYPFPLCARCTGMWLGITLGVAFAMFHRPSHRWWTGSLIALLATSASAFDWLRESSGGDPSAWARAVFGTILFLGFTFAVSFDILAVIVLASQGVHRLLYGNHC